MEKIYTHSHFLQCCNVSINNFQMYFFSSPGAASDLTALCYLLRFHKHHFDSQPIELETKGEQGGKKRKTKIRNSFLTGFHFLHAVVFTMGQVIDMCTAFSGGAFLP